MITKDSKIVSVSNPIYSKSDNSTIDCMATFDSGEVYPYTAADHDNTLYGQQLWAELNAGTHGEISPYVAKNKTQ